ncbi:MAG TPA: glycosyltransferase family 4 protein [Opitutaceae bacterium]|nr:glycosyltransferase family 4 protein [Opitutaceae bacterium]
MRITIVMGFFLPVPALAGGATEKIWHRLAELMAEAGHDVTIISRRWPGLPDRETIGRLTHLRLPGMDHTRFLPANLALDFRWGLRVKGALPPGDVVVCNTVSLPVYLARSRPDAGRVAVVLGRMPKGQNRLYGAADLILATSSAVAAKALQENPALADRLLQFPNPIDWELHRNAASQGAPGAPLTIGYVGRLHPEKGLELLLEAGASLAGQDDLPPWRLALIGPVAVEQGGGGEAYRAQLESAFNARLGGRLEFVPPVFDRAELARRYGGLDVFCYPSRAAKGEGLSIAPIEAMAAGAVPVVSQLDCYRDLIVPGENGLQFDQERADAARVLAELLRGLLRDAPRRRALATRAQATARRFDYRETARVLLDRFAQLTGSARTETIRS